MASEHESTHDFYTILHTEEHRHMDTRSFRSFRNPQPEEAAQSMTDEQLHAIEAGENPQALTADAFEAREELANAAALGFECDDPGDEDATASKT
jgi:hypothetical protein